MCPCHIRVTDAIRNHIKRSYILIFLLRKKSKLQTAKKRFTNYSHPWTSIFPAYVVPYLKSLYLQTHNTKPRAQSRRHDAEDIFEFLNFHDQEITLSVLVQIRK